MTQTEMPAALTRRIGPSDPACGFRCGKRPLDDYFRRHALDLHQLHRHYQRAPLLILDELGFVPLDKVEAELLFNLLADRYERCSTVVTSNLAFGEWVQVFGSEKLTTALLDRLAHHAHILTTKGKSYRSQRTETA